MIQDDPNQPGYGMPAPGYGDYEANYTQQRASYGAIPQGMLMGGYTVGAGAMSGMSNMMADVGRMVRPVSFTPPARMMAGYGGMYAQEGGFFSGAARYAGFGSTPRGVTEYEHDYYNSSDLGERVAGAATSAASMAGGLAVGMAMNPVMKAVGTFAGSALGPAGAAIGGTMGALFGGYGVGMWAAGQVQEGVAQRREIQNFLENSSFRFATSSFGQADPRFGAGMNVGARQQVADTIRSMDIKDPTMDTKELTQIMQQSSQLGLFSGTKDVKEFQTKFKDIVDSVKVVTKTLHQTLEEGLRTIKDLKAIGFDPSEAKNVALEADARGKMAGRTGTEMMQVGLQGAEMFRGTGVSMRIGYESNIMGLSAIRAARDAGELSQEAVAQAGGEEALAQRMTASGLGFAQSAMGRGFAGAFFQAGKGLNVGAFTGAIGGGADFAQTALMSAQNMADPTKVVEYTANQAKYISDMGKQFGGQGLQMSQMGTFMKQAEFMTKTVGGTTENNLKFSLLQAGLSQPEVDAMLARMSNASGEFKSAQVAVAATHDKMVYEQAAINSPLNRLGGRISDIGTGVFDVIAKPLSRSADILKEDIINAKAELYYGIEGVSTGGLSKGTVQRSASYTRRAAAGGPLDLDVGGGLLGESFGETLANSITSGNARLASGKAIGRRGLKSQATVDDIILDTNRGDWGTRPDLANGYGSDFIVSTKDAEELASEAKIARTLNMQSKDPANAPTAAMMSKAEAAFPKLLNSDLKGMAFNDLLQSLTGQTLNTATASDFAVLNKAGAMQPEIGAAVKAYMSGATAAEAIDSATYIQQVKKGEGLLALPNISYATGLHKDVARKVLGPLVTSEMGTREAARYRALAKTQPDRAVELEALAKAEDAKAQKSKDLVDVTLGAEGIGPGQRASVYRGMSDVSDSNLGSTATGLEDIQSAQARLGTGMLADIVRATSGSTNISANEKRLASEFLSRLKANPTKGLIDATSAELGVMTKIGGVGETLGKQAEALHTLFKGVSSEKAAEKLVDIALPGADANMRRQVVEAREKPEALKELVDQGLRTSLAAAAPDSVKTGGNSTNPLSDSGAETTMRTQTDINLQVLSALRALNTKRGG